MHIAAVVRGRRQPGDHRPGDRRPGSGGPGWLRWRRLEAKGSSDTCPLRYAILGPLGASESNNCELSRVGVYHSLRNPSGCKFDRCLAQVSAGTIQHSQDLNLRPRAAPASGVPLLIQSVSNGLLTHAGAPPLQHSRK